MDVVTLRGVKQMKQKGQKTSLLYLFNPDVPCPGEHCICVLGDGQLIACGGGRDIHVHPGVGT